jgi:DNA-binding MarR family transcriptional regulator
MDAVLFEMKKAHLAGTRFGRRMLKPFGGALTPARFNMLLALYEKPMRQSDLWKLLGVVRSVVSEMLDALDVVGWVKAIRAADAGHGSFRCRFEGARSSRRRTDTAYAAATQPSK